jgi:hypothetical protein
LPCNVFGPSLSWQMIGFDVLKQNRRFKKPNGYAFFAPRRFLARIPSRTVGENYRPYRNG